MEHLSETDQSVLRLAVNRLGEKGEWSLDELKIEFEELILNDAPIEVSGFSLDEIDQNPSRRPSAPGSQFDNPRPGAFRTG